MEQILSPSEINKLVQQILVAVDQQASPPPKLARLQQLLATFSERWQGLFIRFGQQPAGEMAYRDTLLYFQAEIAPLARQWLAATGPGQHAITTIETMLLSTPVPANRFNRNLLTQFRQQRRQQMALPQQFECPRFERPLFIVSAPRAGSTLLFETLAQFAEVWTIGRESHDLETDIPELHPATHHYISNRLTEVEATPAVNRLVRRWFSQRLQNRAGCLYLALAAEQRPAAVRFLEKTPKNALRIPWLKEIFPQARFIFLYREPRQNISSLLEGWRSRRFVAYRDMPGWPYPRFPWSFLLTPAWETLLDRPLVEIAAQQWRVTNHQIWADLQRLPKTDWCFVTYQALTERPVATLQQISQFAGLRWDETMEQAISAGLPLAHTVLSPPSADKWRKHEAEIEAILLMVEPLIKQIAPLLSLAPVAIAKEVQPALLSS